MKGITKNRHGIADYTYVPLVLAAPELARFAREKNAATVCRAFAGIVLGYSLLTDARWGVIKLIPYKTHAALDLSVGIASLATPLLLRGTGKRARNTFLAMGITGIVVGTLSLIGAKRG